MNDSYFAFLFSCRFFFFFLTFHPDTRHFNPLLEKTLLVLGDLRLRVILEFRV